ncbi:MAG: hypothetical protein IKO00_06665 [Oscillospiraceae bacterium]|nr:hypothetical protein [Oscillospiraceae bacterium]
MFDSIIDARHAANKPVIVVSCDLPYDAARFPEADAMLLTYGATAMREVPAAPTGAGSAYMPNLPAALCACFGQEATEGELPVSIPALSDRYEITDQVLYGR